VKRLIKRLFDRRMDISAPFGVIVLLSPWQLSGDRAVLLYSLGIGFIVVGGLIRFWSVRYCGKRRTLSTTGPYKVCRNPIYLANIIIGVGFILFAHLWWLLPFFLLYAFIRYSSVVKKEEKALEKRFGREYLEYKNRVRRWLPNLLHMFDRERRPLYKWKEVIKSDVWGIIACALVIAFLFLKNNLFDCCV